MNLSIKSPNFIRFIADLHLTPNSLRLKSFHEFLDSLPKECKGLFILGDLFDHWLGSDLHAKDYYDLQAKLKSCTCPIYFMPGNKDFTLEDHWLKAANIQRLPDPYKLTINHHQILLTHGDQLCTHDKIYQIFRLACQNSLIKSSFLCLPKSWRLSFLHLVRSISGKQNNLKKYCVNDQKAIQLCNRYKVKTLIHGHVHHPGIHTIYQNIKRIVLDEWTANHSSKTVSFLDIDGCNNLELYQT